MLKFLNAAFWDRTLLQLLSHRCFGRASHRHQGDRLPLFAAQRSPHGKLTQPDAQDDQTFASSNLNSVVDDPHPAVGDDRRTKQGRQPDRTSQSRAVDQSAIIPGA